MKITPKAFVKVFGFILILSLVVITVGMFCSSINIVYVGMYIGIGAFAWFLFTFLFTDHFDLKK